MTDEEKELYMKYCKYDKEPKEVIMDLINLIEKQQAEIEDWGKEYNHWVHKAVTRAIELETKDKIIDEMAKCMEINGKGRRGFSCMFRGNEECNENGCRVCIKEYFKKKVEDK